MNCRDFEMNVLALARNKLIDTNRRDASLAHTVNCVSCADRLAGERALLAGVRLVVAAVAEEKAPDSIGTALVTAFREHAPSVTRDTAIPMPLRGARHWRFEAAAAAIVILVSMVAVLWLYSRSRIEKPVSASAPPAPTNTHEPASQAAPRDLEIASNPAIIGPNRSHHRGARPKTSVAEEVTEFFPLIEGIDLDSLEAVQSVRVELPASALVDLGLPANTETPTRPVKADVLLGLDGMARAIRFVR